MHTLWEARFSKLLNTCLLRNSDRPLSFLVNYVCGKATRLLGFLKRNLRNCPRALKELSYKHFILPTLDYAVSIWDPYHCNNINKIEMIQHRAARFVLNCPWRRDIRDGISSMLQLLGWPTLPKMCNISPHV